MAERTINDPFSLAYDGVFSLLESYAPFTSLFRAKNIIRYDKSELHPVQEGREDADLPEFQLRPNGFPRMSVATSSTYKATCSYIGWVTEGAWDVRLQNEIIWNLAIALLRWHNTGAIAETEWDNYRMFTDVRIIDISTGETLISETERQVMDGWSSEVGIEADLIFQRQSIIG